MCWRLLRFSQYWCLSPCSLTQVKHFGQIYEAIELRLLTKMVILSLSNMRLAVVHYNVSNSLVMLCRCAQLTARSESPRAHWCPGRRGRTLLSEFHWRSDNSLDHLLSTIGLRLKWKWESICNENTVPFPQRKAISCWAIRKVLCWTKAVPKPISHYAWREPILGYTLLPKATE